MSNIGDLGDAKRRMAGREDDEWIVRLGARPTDGQRSQLPAAIVDRVIEHTAHQAQVQALGTPGPPGRASTSWACGSDAGGAAEIEAFRHGVRQLRDDDLTREDASPGGWARTSQR